MTRYNESDLRSALEEGSRRSAAAPADVEEIKNKGRRIRRRRVGLGLAMAGSAVAVSVVVVAPLSTFGESEVVSLNGESLPSGEGLPETWRSPRGELLRIYSGKHSRLEEGGAVTFTPTSDHTEIVVRCADPASWLIVDQSVPGRNTRDLREQGEKVELPPGDGEAGDAEGVEESGVSHKGKSVSIGRCGGSRGEYSHSWHSFLSTGKDWVGRPQEIKVWVLPASVPLKVIDSAEGDFLKVCEKIKRSKGLCDGSYLVDPGNPEKALSEIVEGSAAVSVSWELAIYDERETR